MHIRCTVFIFILFFPLFIYSQSPYIKLEYLAIENGLSQSGVQCILQDSKGFIWFGTYNGLNKYDGYRFTVYLNDPEDSTSISANGIRALYEDSTGNLWIGTFGGGLNRFNPKTEIFIRYIYDRNNPKSLRNNYIRQNALHEDHSGNLWIGTAGGLSQIGFNPIGQNDEKFEFINYKEDLSFSHSVHHYDICAIYEDKNNNIWVGAQDGCIKKVDINNRKLITTFNSDNLSKLLNIRDEKWIPGRVMLIYQDTADGENVLTIGSSNSMYKYNHESGKFIGCNKNLINILNKKEIDNFRTIFRDQNGSVWVGTDQGLYVIDDKDNVNEFYKDVRNKLRKDDTQDVNIIYEDRQGIFWIGTDDEGVAKYDPRIHNFIYHDFKISQEKCFITAILRDISGIEETFWLGTGSKGLIKFNRRTKKITHYQGDIRYPIISLLQDVNNPYIWIGTRGDGLYIYDIKKAKFVGHYFPSKSIAKEGKPHDFKLSNTIKDMVQDEQGKIWIATLHGLYQFNPATKKVKTYLHEPDNPNNLNDNQVITLLKTGDKEIPVLWIGTRLGLNKLNLITYKFSHYRNNLPGETSLYVNTIYESGSDTLLIGTIRGLYKFSKTEGKFYRILDKDKKMSIEIMAIFKDNNKNLWMYTPEGFHRFDRKTKTVRVFNQRDGIPAIVLGRHSYHCDRVGNRYFGHFGGFIEFNPDLFVNNSHIPPVVLTDFQILNKLVKPGPNSPLDKSIPYCKEITLSHNQSIVSFDFSALDFCQPERNKYAYKMEGVDLDWVYTDASRRFTTYTQLDPGNYTFRVKGSNNDGVWNEEGTSIKIIIVPPWWKTNLAYTFYLLFFVSMVYGIWRFQLNRERMKQQLRMEHFEAEKLRDVDYMKSRFFANISHEFRTPLTLIMGPIQNILAKDRDLEAKKELKLVLRNASRLERLVNQLLDLSRLEAGKMYLQVEQIDIIALLRKIVLAFTSLAERKRIDLKYKSTSKSLLVYIDRDKIEKIINNLLSNAFKFTPERGKIIVNCGLQDTEQSKGQKIKDKMETESKISDKNHLLPLDSSGPNHPRFGQHPISNIQHPTSQLIQITVTNTGPAIPDNKIDKIFDRFYQVDDSYTRDHEGTGIGLSLVKELIDLHHGTITVQSTNKRTVFSIQLPLTRDAYTKDEIPEMILQKEAAESEEMANELMISASPENDIKEEPMQVAQKEKPLVLLIEDNPDMRQYIRDHLKEYYRLIEAVNGRQGWEHAKKSMPELIISDIMMPEMDGYQVCEKIKTDIHTSHIPVILLTARAEIRDKLKGLEIGADDYIAKPFVIDELKVRMKNLIDQRQKLRERFRREALFGINNIALTQHDEKFLQQAMALIEDHIDDPHITVQKFGELIGMSRVSLHLKLKALTNQSPHQFIRLIRLKKAALLLQQKTINVTEVAYEVGFRDLSHFAKVFKEQFGETPSQFSARH